MDMKRSRVNKDGLDPRQRRRAVVLLLAAGMVRTHGRKSLPEKSAESRQEALGCAAETRPCVPIG
jgi:hypothetical protein